MTAMDIIPSSSNSNVLQELSDRLKALETENRLLRQQPRNSAPEPRVALPEKFNGDRRKFRGFLNQVELLFMLNPNCYFSDPLKVGLIGTLLTEKALNWFSPILERSDAMLDDYKVFREALIASFEEPDKSIIAATKIRNLSQGSLPVFNYASEFRLLAASLDWNDAALIHLFRVGLNEEVKDLLLHHEIPNSLESMINLAIIIDNRLYEHRLEKIASSRTYLSRPVRNFQQPDTSNYVPMEINAFHKHRPITAEERERRKANGLCLYYGSPDHQRSECPVAPPAKKPNFQNSLKLKSH